MAVLAKYWELSPTHCAVMDDKKRVYEYIILEKYRDVKTWVGLWVGSQVVLELVWRTCEEFPCTGQTCTGDNNH